jgi:toxin ParE1/3/4
MEKRKEIKILSRAKEDFIEIVEYIAQDKPEAATDVADRIEASINHLGQNPSMGKRSREPRLAHLGYRYLVVGKYLIFYTVDDVDEDIIIHRILHRARDYVGLLS